VKLILGAGDSLAGRLLLVDALAMRFREMRLRKDPECPVCGEHPTVRELIDYEAFCGIGAEPRDESGIEVTVTDLARELETNPGLLLIDVREPREWEICRIPGAQLIPLGELPGRLNELDGHREMVMHCHKGSRSMRAVQLLRAAGFSRVRNLQGGIDAWSREVDDTIPRY
jgi:adenylyltransferase/sulfurtransferase